ncbi:MAG: GNAT family N-acetyltransferase [Alphaproteobacteria bacterium]
MIKQILKNKDYILREKINPNIIHNRFDILYQDYDLYEIDGYFIPVKINNNYAYLGLYLTKIDAKTLDNFYQFLFTKHCKLEYLEVKHSYTSIEFADPYPYWHINLPNTKEEFDKQLHSKVRYNTKWYPKKINQNVGSFQIVKHSFEGLTKEMISLFLLWKKENYNFNYTNDPIEYITEKGITSGYTLEIDAKIQAVGFICETDDNVYFENFSYNPIYEKYSLGMVLYYSIIMDLIKINKKTFYLSGGCLDYKRRYNGIQTTTYSGKIYRCPEEIKRAFLMADKIKRYMLPKFIKKKLVKIWAKNNLPPYCHPAFSAYYKETKGIKS